MNAEGAARDHLAVEAIRPTACPRRTSVLMRTITGTRAMRPITVPHRLGELVAVQHVDALLAQEPVHWPPCPDLRGRGFSPITRTPVLEVLERIRQWPWRPP